MNIHQGRTNIDVWLQKGNFYSKSHWFSDILYQHELGTMFIGRNRKFSISDRIP